MDLLRPTPAHRVVIGGYIWHCYSTWAYFHMARLSEFYSGFQGDAPPDLVELATTVSAMSPVGGEVHQVFRVYEKVHQSSSIGRPWVSLDGVRVPKRDLFWNLPGNSDLVPLQYKAWELFGVRGLLQVNEDRKTRTFFREMV